VLSQGEPRDAGHIIIILQRYRTVSLPQHGFRQFKCWQYADFNGLRAISRR